MTVEECYNRMGADYNDIMRRLINEGRVKKYLQMFTGDESYSKLCSAMEQDRGEEAFRAAHSMKGISANLGLSRIFNASDALTEELRGKKVTQSAKSLAGRLDEEYWFAIANIRELLEV